LSAKVVDFIEQKRRVCNKELMNWLKKGEITEEVYEEFVLDNEQLSQILKTTFVNGEGLIQKQIVNSYSKLFEFRKKPHSDEEAFETMRELIIEGSENPCIRKLAVDIAEKTSLEQGISVPVPNVDKLYSQFPSDTDDQSIIAFIQHCGKVAKALYTFVQSRKVYVSDPPDDYFQPPLFTLEILNLRGDCDDLAMLLCSLYRSIGYRTFIGVQAQHVYAGIVLLRPAVSLVNENGSASLKNPKQYVEVPADPLLDDFEITTGPKSISFGMFDVLTGEFLGNLGRQIAQMKSFSEEETNNVKKNFEGVLKTLDLMSGAKVFFVDSGVLATVKLAEVLRDDLSKF